MSRGRPPAASPKKSTASVKDAVEDFFSVDGLAGGVFGQKVESPSTFRWISLVPVKSQPSASTLAHAKRSLRLPTLPLSL